MVTRPGPTSNWVRGVRSRAMSPHPVPGSFLQFRTGSSAGPSRFSLGRTPASFLHLSASTAKPARSVGVSREREAFLGSTTSGPEGSRRLFSHPATRGCGARYGCVCVCLCGEGVWREGCRERRGRGGAGSPLTDMGVFFPTSPWRPPAPPQAL